MTAKQEGTATWPEPRFAGIVLVAVLLVYAPSLGGGWVWDDHSLLAANPALSDPALLFGRDVWGPTGSPSDLYRPLVMATHVGQNVFPGPLIERLLNLGLHLLAVALVARLARVVGAPAAPAWLAAAVFGLHPGTSEPVAWVTGRHDLLPGVIFLGAVAALVARRDVLAGALLAVLPFAKEPYLLTPVALLPLLVALRRPALPALVLAALGVGAYLGVRELVALPLPPGAASALGPGSVGAVAARGVELAVLPVTADALAPYRPDVAAGLVAGLFGLALLPFVRRLEVALVLAALILLAPTAPASARIDMVADRYFYLLFAAVSVASSVVLARVWAERRAAFALAAIPIVLAPLTALRAREWSSDADVFGASLALHPDNPHAAFHVAHDLHTRAGDCAAAIPLYARAVDAEPRARNNLLACFLAEERYAEAATLGPEAAARDPENPNPAANTARALVALGDVAGAERWALTATEREPTAAKHWVLLGNLRGRAGRFAEAAEAFERALAIEPGSADAGRGLALAKERAAGSGGVAGGDPPPQEQPR